MKVKYPRVKQDSKQRVYVEFYHRGNRYRLFNGKRINSTLSPNSYPINERKEIGNLLAAEVYQFLNSGLIIELFRKSKFITNSMSDLDYLGAALDFKKNSKYSEKYIDTLQYVFDLLKKNIKSTSISYEDISALLNKYTSEVSHNTIRRHLKVLFNEAQRLGMKHNPIEQIQSKKSRQKLYKPFKNIKELLAELKHFNQKLHLCCLLTYGCLLRPHREIRELTWNDFSDDISYINLSGRRNKSGKNRIVPVPSFIKPYLFYGKLENNIFTDTPFPPNKDYFKTLWGRFKIKSKILESNQTLYSFRHTGAIDIFNRTGSLTKLQHAMGHSNINVSLTYLRGLEVPELDEEDMPKLT